MRPLSTTTLTKIDIHDVSRVSTNDFSLPGALCDDQSSTQTKRGMYTVSTSQQTESTIQQHPTLRYLSLSTHVEIVTLYKSIVSLWLASY